MTLEEFVCHRIRPKEGSYLVKSDVCNAFKACSPKRFQERFGMLKDPAVSFGTLFSNLFKDVHRSALKSGGASKMSYKDIELVPVDDAEPPDKRARVDVE